jgi:hypothetical protein
VTSSWFFFSTYQVANFDQQRTGVFYLWQIKLLKRYGSGVLLKRRNMCANYDKNLLNASKLNCGERDMHFDHLKGLLFLLLVTKVGLKITVKETSCAGWA